MSETMLIVAQIAAASLQMITQYCANGTEPTPEQMQALQNGKGQTDADWLVELEKLRKGTI